MRKRATIWSGASVAVLLLLGLTGGAAGLAQAADADSPWLGVMMQALDDRLREAMDYKGDGVLVSRVVEGSAAEKAGVRKGDVIASVNGRSVDSPDALSRVIRDARVGQTVSLVVVRDRQRRTLSARLGSRPDESDLELPDTGDMGAPGRLRRDLDIEVLPKAPLGDHEPMVMLQGMGRGRLGVRAEDLSQDLAPYFSAPAGSGALVLEVLKDTPAEKAGIKAGDVVTQVGDRKIADADDLIQAVREAAEGKLQVTLMRKGVRHTVEAELEAAPRAWRERDGRDFMVMGPRDHRIVIRRGPGGADAPAAPEALRDELRELRQELRELRMKLEKLEDRD